MDIRIKKLVLPVAGLGTRLRPLTLTTPKWLVPLCNKPIIQYHLEEAQECGFEEIVFVINPEHEAQFKQYIGQIQNIFPRTRFHMRIQEKALGDGLAVLQAKDIVGDGPFVVRFVDDIIVGGDILANLKNFFDIYQAPVILLRRVPRETVSRWGIVGAEVVNDQLAIYRLTQVVEKPKVEEAPSNLSIVGGYVITPSVLNRVETLYKNFSAENGELRLADAFSRELENGASIYGWEFPGKRLDCGTLEGLQEAEEFLAGQATN